MHDADRVRRGQRARHLAHDPCHVRDRHRTLGDAVGQGATAQQPEHQEGTTWATPEVVEGNHVRVLEARHQLGLCLEALHEPRVVRELGADHLHRHLSTDAGLHRPVHGPEGTLPDHLAQLVARDGDGRRRHERGVADDHAVLELHQLVGGRQAGLLGQVVVEPSIGPQCLGLAATQVQGPHQQLDEPLAQGLFGHPTFQVGHHLCMTSERQLHLGALLQRHQPQLFEASGHRSQPPLVGVVAERPPRPQPERTVIGVDGRLALGRPSFGQQQLEVGGVVGHVVEDQHVAGLPSDRRARRR